MTALNLCIHFELLRLAKNLFDMNFSYILITAGFALYCACFLYDVSDLWIDFSIHH